MALALRDARPLASKRARVPGGVVLALLSVALLAVAAYLSTPANYWVGDDYNYLVPKGWDRVLLFFNPAVPSRAFYRPLVWTTWAFDYALWGKEPFGWHVTSILMHVATTLSAALLARVLLHGWGVATLAGALFAVHPAHPEAVTWINGRTDEGCGLIYIPTVLLFALYLRRRAEGSGGAGLYALSLLLAFGALFAKETAVTLPLALLLTDLFFFSRPGLGRDWAAWRERAARHVPFFALVAAYLLVRYYLVAAGIVRANYSGYTNLNGRNLLDAAASNVLLALGVPGGPQIAPGLPDAAKLTILAAGLAAALALVRWLGRSALYSLLWVVATLLPTSLVSSARYLYTPSFGVCLLAALALWKVLDATKTRYRGYNLGYAFATLFMLAWGLSVLYQNVTWYRAGAEARSVLSQVRAIAPDPPRPATIYFAGAPTMYRFALLFNTGLPAAMNIVYGEGGVELHEVEQPEPDPVIREALGDPPRFRPNPLFMGYKGGKVSLYPTFAALLAAGTGKQ